MVENNMVFEGKKLLVMGGNDTHIKIIKAAKDLGVYTVVSNFD